MVPRSNTPADTYAIFSVYLLNILYLSLSFFSKRKMDNPVSWFRHFHILEVHPSTLGIILLVEYICIL